MKLTIDFSGLEKARMSIGAELADDADVLADQLVEVEVAGEVDFGWLDA